MQLAPRLPGCISVGPSPCWRARQQRCVPINSAGGGSTSSSGRSSSSSCHALNASALQRPSACMQPSSSTQMPLRTGMPALRGAGAVLGRGQPGASLHHRLQQQQQQQQPSVVCASASAGGAASLPEPEQPHHHTHKLKRGRGPVLLGVAAASLVAAGIALFVSGHAAALQAAAMNGPLGRSGLLASFCLIFLSELGDKTFFIAGLLAMRLGRGVAFAGSLLALSVMTAISVGIGAVCSKLPESLQSSLPLGEMAGVALLVFFGIKALLAARATDAGTSTSEDELADAQEAVAEATSSGRIAQGSSSSPLGSLLEVASLIFLAEWGDRSMLATIALGAAQNPIGVAVGATAGHALATALAVAGGALAGKYVSEKTVNLISGILFLLFAAATVFTLA